MITDTGRNIRENILHVHPDTFEDTALSVFRYQATKNPVYQQFLELLSIKIDDVRHIENIPFLPISCFKSHQVLTNQVKPEIIFTSSGTTGDTTSRHYLADTSFYNQIAISTFEKFYGNLDSFCILALLPAYLERKGSSLVYMVEQFIQKSNHPKSGFYLNNLDDLAKTLQFLQNNDTPVLLIGVSFALLDLAEAFPMDLSNVIIMETGGMKGRRKEMTRSELHQQLKDAFNVKMIHSEYGMTELISQGYSKGQGVFYPAPTMKLFTREITDPFAYQTNGKTGVLNIIDLGNLDSCSFIATDDLGRVYEDGSFEVLGRLDASDIRGCNLMVGSV